MGQSTHSAVVPMEEEEDEDDDDDDNDDQIKKNKMDGAFGAYGGGERRVQGFGRET